MSAAATDAAVPVPAGTTERADLAAWLAVAAGTLGAFMALLDISIVNASLPVIQGEIGATQSEGTWVGTSYLVAEIVVMPLTAWLERLLGLRRVLLLGASLFTAFSVVCGFADDLTTMIFGRIGQGLAGGTMIPCGMTIMARRLPPGQQAIGLAIFASAALMGPILGPLLGGWITETYSWHYAFFINVPICAGLVVLILAGLRPERGNLSELANADWLGIFGVMIFLGALTILLEEGHREQWFESPLIWQLAFGVVLGFALLAAGQVRARQPVLKLALLRDRALSSVLTLMMVTGAMLFGTLFVVPQFLAAVAGYNPFQAGQVIFLSGAVGMVAALFYPVLVSRLDLRVMVGTAIAILSLALYLMSQLTSESRGEAFLLSQLLLGVGVTFASLPLQQAALSAVPVEDAAQATSMFNIARNLGASIALAGLASFMDQRIELHHWQLQGAIDANDPEVGRQMTEMAMQFGGTPEALAGAYRMIDAQVMGQSMVMAFNDIFLVLSALAILAVPLVLLLKPIDPTRAQGAMH